LECNFHVLDFVLCVSDEYVLTVGGENVD